MATTSSPSARLIPLTPMETLPVLLTSVSLNRMHCPYFVTRITSFLLLVAFTSISSSSSRSAIAARPTFRTFAYSCMGVFLTRPFRVAIIRYWPSSNRLIGITAVIFSSGISWRRLIIAVPLAVLPASGIS